MTDFRVTQSVIEVLNGAPTTARVTQAVIELLTSAVATPGNAGNGPAKGLANAPGHSNEHGAVVVVPGPAGSGIGKPTKFPNLPGPATDTGALQVTTLTAGAGRSPFAALDNLRVTSDDQGSLRVASVTAGVLGPLQALANVRCRTDETGALLVTTGPAGVQLGPLTPLMNVRARSDDQGALVVTGLSTANAYRNAVIADGAFAYWRFTETTGQVLDSVGAAHGTISGTVARGIAGALTSDPTNPSVQFAGAGSIDIPSFTLPVPCSVEAWVKQTGPTAGHNSIWTNRTAGVSTNFFFILQTGQPQWGRSGGSTAAPGGVRIDDGNWHHVVGTASGATIEIYVDGVLADTKAETDGPLTSVSAIGSDPFGGFATIFVDELALYPTVLTPAKVAAHFALR